MTTSVYGFPTIEEDDLHEIVNDYNALAFEMDAEVHEADLRPYGKVAYAAEASCPDWYTLARGQNSVAERMLVIASPDLAVYVVHQQTYVNTNSGVDRYLLGTVTPQDVTTANGETRSFEIIGGGGVGRCRQSSGTIFSSSEVLVSPNGCVFAPRGLRLRPSSNNNSTLYDFLVFLKVT